MSLTDVSSPRPLRTRRARRPRHFWVIWAALAIYAVASIWILAGANAVPRFRFDPTPLIESGVAIQVHVAAAVLTLAIGTGLMFAPKGFRFHRTAGWAWVASMAVTAGSSFFITAIFQTHYSPIHALSAWTMIGLPMGIAAIKRRDIASHRKAMTDMFVGGMLLAGLFSLLPGRMLWHVFFAV